MRYSSKEVYEIAIFFLIVFSTTFHCAGQAKLNKKGFTKIFNGKNLDGWYLKIRNGDEALAKKVYTVDNGTVHIFKDFPAEYELNNGKNETHGLFYTNKKYSMFIFKFEYKWGKGIANNFNQFQYDAGMYYHVVDDKIWPVGIEYQVRFNHLENRNHTGDFWASNLKWYSKEGSSFAMPSEGGKPVLDHKGEHRAAIGVKFNALNNKWNKCEVIVMGDMYTIHKLNGKVVNVATDLPFSEGVIGLQSETAEIFYRNIKIKEFDEVVPMETFLKDF